ncbi:uncharacterized protein V1513DRAFT_432437 [Lipomyces chichibuensis]|uniref:uncharacterized protein n=1 Tax=Lipomyces chichibuensis TaxID=1546026 RepID=UPI003343AA8F
MYPGYLMQPQLQLQSPAQIPYRIRSHTTSLPIILYRAPPRDHRTPQALQGGNNAILARFNADEDDADILALSFNWKISNTGNSDRRTEWQPARDVVFRNDWSVREMQQMEDGISAMYQRTVQAGISDNLPVVPELSSNFLKRTIGA